MSNRTRKGCSLGYKCGWRANTCNNSVNIDLRKSILLSYPYGDGYIYIYIFSHIRETFVYFLPAYVGKNRILDIILEKKINKYIMISYKPLDK